VEGIVLGDKFIGPCRNGDGWEGPWGCMGERESHSLFAESHLPSGLMEEREGGIFN